MTLTDAIGGAGLSAVVSTLMAINENSDDKAKLLFNYAFLG